MGKAGSFRFGKAQERGNGKTALAGLTPFALSLKNNEGRSPEWSSGLRYLKDMD
jgi:hypothetical protein